jgi:hypothetical protein
MKYCDTYSLRSDRCFRIDIYGYVDICNLGGNVIEFILQHYRDFFEVDQDHVGNIFPT